MEIQRWTGPPVETHCYLIYDRDAGEGWVFDAPLSTFDRVNRRAGELGIRLSRLILTHCHFDHLLDAALYRAAGIPVLAHPAGEVLLRLPQTQAFGLPQPMPQIQVDEPVGEGRRLELGGESWEVWHVPGHAPGHIALYSPGRGTLVGGDLVFQNGYGRIDLPFADPGEMARSLRRLLSLPDTTVILPGHGPRTTVGRERPWIEELTRTGLG